MLYRWLSEVRTCAKQSLVALVLTSPPDRAIPVGRQNLETKVLRARHTGTRSAPLTDVTWPGLECEHWPQAIPVRSKWRAPSAEATRTRAPTTGIGQKSSALPLSYRGGQNIQLFYRGGQGSTKLCHETPVASLMLEACNTHTRTTTKVWYEG